MMNEYVLEPSTFIIQSPPGDTLLEALGKRGMTQAELALRTGRPLKTINEIIKGKAAITPETALQFERVLGISAAFWINREQQYRESAARQAERREMEQHLAWLNEFPVNEMVQLGWLNPSEDGVEQLQALLQYFGVAEPSGWHKYWTTAIPNIAQSPSFSRSPGSTTAWLRKGELQAQANRCQPYQAGALRELSEYLREWMLKPLDEIYSDLLQMFARAGVALSVVQVLPNASIQQVTRWLSPTKALLQLSTGHNRKNLFWQAVYHGVGHILLHGKREVFLEEGVQADSPQEAEAERFVLDLIGSYQWPNQEPEISWEFLQEEDKTEDDWGDIAEESVQSSPDSAQQPPAVDIRSISGWPGLSAGAQRALLAAGMADEAGRVDERLFAEWVSAQIASIESALAQSYYREAMMDLENLISIVNLGAMRSPGLGAMIASLNLLKQTIQVRPEQELLLSARQAILQTNRPTHSVMISEARKRYSLAATQAESELADELFKNR